MPLVKRINLPVDAPPRPLIDVFKELRRRSSDVAWIGQDKEAADLEKQALEIKARIDAGELYEGTHHAIDCNAAEHSFEGGR
jgi:hypothetical protein